MTRDRSVVRGLVFHGPGQAPAIEELHLDPPGPGEVRVRMVASGVCHSDLHVVDGDWERPADVVMGHEGAAIVEELGPGAGSGAESGAGSGAEGGVGVGGGADADTDARADAGANGLRVGDLVVLAWTAPCGACPACGRGEAWLCAAPLGAGHRLAPELVRLHRPDGTPVGAYSGIGTFATHQVVAAGAAIAIDPRTPPEVAALIGCAASTGVGAVRNTAAVRPADSVVVVGLGGVGLSAIMAAVAAGASPIIGVDLEPAKRELALELGATRSVEADSAVRVVRELTGGGADHVLECIGRTSTAELALDLARPGGTITLVGMTPQGERAGLDVYRFVEDGKRLLGSNYGSSVPARDFPVIAADVVAGRLPLGRLVEERIGLDDVVRAFDAMRRRQGLRRVVAF